MSDLAQAIELIHAARGNRVANAPGPEAPSGVVNIRRQAGLRALETGPSSGGNAHSNTPGHAPESEGKTDVKPPVKSPPDRTQKMVEGVPPFAKESLSGDGFAKAALKAKEMFAARK